MLQYLNASEKVISQKKSCFLSLAIATRAYLCAPCTSVESEQRFSAAGNIVDDQRNNVTSKNEEILIILKVNLPLMLLERKEKEEN